MGKKRVLYLMHVDWKWIYQRPHVIAKGLEKDYDVTVAYLFNYRQQKTMQQNNSKPQKMVRIYNIPYEGKNIFLYLINKLWLKMYRGKFRKENYDIVWMTSPVMVKYIDITDMCKVVYDCMDDEVAMRAERENARLIDRVVLKYDYIKSKEFLLKRADYVFFSSQFLYKKFKKQCAGEATLVRNGYQQRDLHYDTNRANKKENFAIGYIGTIEKWMNVNLLKESVVVFPDICYHLVGPSAVAIEESANIILEGVVEHDSLYYKIADYDALIMPFIINDIILAVDPVKLYEYISYGKCIISVYYEEIERFSEFVYFYKTKEEYYALLQEFRIKGFRPKYSQEQQESFLYENIWNQRIKTMRNTIEDK